MEGWRRVTARLKTFGARDIAITAVFSGLVFVLTMVAIPMPAGGFWHFGNAMIILSGLMFGGLVGGLSGSIGATLADLVLGYGMWAPWTVWIKFFVGFLPGIVSDGKSVPRTILGICLGWLANFIANRYLGFSDRTQEGDGFIDPGSVHSPDNSMCQGNWQRH